ncbi:MAG TPA: 4Fe-4S binding protein [Phycisphaerae bacterium]|nr:4Fe-4S binding protein [Phycisphaerae bacterium]
MRRTRQRQLTRLRRAVQLAFLLAFFAVLLAARPTPGKPPPTWLGFFVYIDPLILLVTLVASHALVVGLLLALVTSAITLVFGRVFCGWICPLGTLHTLVGKLRWHRLRPLDNKSHWHLGKYVVLLSVVIGSIFGVSWLVLLDPQVLLFRTVTTAIWPLAQGGIEDAATAIYSNDPHLGSWHLTSLSEPIFRAVHDHAIVKSQQSFLGSGLILAVFLAILGLNFLRPRFWCRYICPLGGLLGLLAWRPWLERKVAKSQCNECDLCGMTCPARAVGTGGDEWRHQECLECMKCMEVCPKGAVAFRFPSPRRARIANVPVDLTRRHLLGAGALGVIGAAILRSSPQARGETFNPQLIRPPGARPERDFLSRCTACGLCMKICPTGGLQPTLTEAGIEGLWTPRLVPSLGYCDFECNRCGQVCPTQAIRPLSLDEKKHVTVGLASVDTDRCLAYAYGRDCLVCEEHCPIPEKAIYLAPAEIALPDGSTRIVQQPHVDADYCTGCGICEHVCPFKDRPAIRVTSAGETRHPGNQPLLQTPRRALTPVSLF